MNFTGLSTKYRGEIAVTLAALAGWALLTAGVATVVSARQAHALWLASTGLLLLSLCGWKFLRTIVADGLYVLTRNDNA